jgi:antitoxin component YwqK of YwqJK toxin-antitoxin module
VGEIVQRGNYNLDEKTGIWKYHYIDNNKIRFVGNFKNNEPDGIHKWYYPNGNIEIYGTYRMGKKNKDWKKYNPDGSLLTTYTYRNDRLIKIDGVKLYRGRKK